MRAGSICSTRGSGTAAPGDGRHLEEAQRERTQALDRELIHDRDPASERGLDLAIGAELQAAPTAVLEMTCDAAGRHVVGLAVEVALQDTRDFVTARG
jgi:hypothetical protein